MRHHYLQIVALPLILFALTTAIVLAIDPYDLFPWGITPLFTRDTYNPSETPAMIRVVTKSDVDTFYIGASTSAPFAARDMERILPGAKHAFNLSILGASMADLTSAMQFVARAPKVNRAIVQLDLPFVTPGNVVDKRFVHIPEAIGAPNFYNAFKSVDHRAIRLAWRLLTNPNHAYDELAIDSPVRFLDWAVAHYQTPDYVARLRLVIDQNRDRLRTPEHDISCDGFSALKTLHDFAAELARRGAELDVVFPPYSTAMWFEWVTPTSDFFGEGFVTVGGVIYSRLDAILAMRGCAVDMLRPMANARFYAFDTDRAITGNYANYADPGHLMKNDALLAILTAIAKQTHRIDADNFHAYARTLREQVLNYKLRISEAE